MGAFTWSMVVSAQPVAPSTGSTLAAGALLPLRRLTWNGQDDEATTLAHEVVDLYGGVVPVAAHELALLAQQGEGSLELLAIEGVGVGDAQLGLLVLEVQGRVGDVDGAVEGLHPALVGLAVGKLHLLEDHVPARGRLLEDLGVVEETFEPHW